MIVIVIVIVMTKIMRLVTCPSQSAFAVQTFASLDRHPLQLSMIMTRIMITIMVMTMIFTIAVDSYDCFPKSGQ